MFLVLRSICKFMAKWAISAYTQKSFITLLLPLPLLDNAKMLILSRPSATSSPRLYPHSDSTYIVHQKVKYGHDKQWRIRGVGGMGYAFPHWPQSWEVLSTNLLPLIDPRLHGAKLHTFLLARKCEIPIMPKGQLPRATWTENCNCGMPQ